MPVSQWMTHLQVMCAERLQSDAFIDHELLQGWLPHTYKTSASPPNLESRSLTLWQATISLPLSL